MKQFAFINSRTTCLPMPMHQRCWPTPWNKKKKNDLPRVNWLPLQTLQHTSHPALPIKISNIAPHVELVRWHLSFMHVQHPRTRRHILGKWELSLIRAYYSICLETNILVKILPRFWLRFYSKIYEQDLVEFRHKL